MRLIDAETLNKELNDLPYGIRGIIKTMVHEQPAVDIVECKDCKYKIETEDGEWNPEDIVCDYWASDGLEADDFCSRGERR